MSPSCAPPRQQMVKVGPGEVPVINVWAAGPIDPSIPGIYNLSQKSASAPYNGLAYMNSAIICPLKQKRAILMSRRKLAES